MPNTVRRKRKGADASVNSLWDVARIEPGSRSGLRIRIHPGVHPFVRRELLTYGRWLRASYAFPVRVNVYIPNALKIRASDGELCWGRLLWTGEMADPAIIDVAGGCRAAEKRALQNHVWATIFTLTHELSHYFQRLKGVELTPRGTEWQATFWAHRVMDEYYEAEWDGIDDWEAE